MKNTIKRDSQEILLNQISDSKSRILSLILEVIIFVSSLTLIYMLILARSAQHKEKILISLALVALVLMLVAYLLNRQKRYTLSSWLMVIMFPAFIFTSAIINSEDPIDFFPYLIVGIMVCGLLFSLRTTIIFSFINLAAITIIVALVIAHPDWEQVIFAELFILMIAAVFFIFIFQRENNEKNLRRQNEYLVALHETSIAVMNRLDLKDLLRVLLNRAARLVNAEHGEIALVDNQTNHIVSNATLGFFETSQPRSIAMGQGIMGTVWQTGEPMVITSYDTWEKRLPEIPKGILQAVVCVPFKSDNRILGMLALSHQQTDIHFDQDDLYLLKRFAELAAIAIDNAALYAAAQQEIKERTQVEKALQQYNQSITALHRVAVTISSALDLDEALDNLVDATKIIFPKASVATVQILDPEAQTMKTCAASPRLDSYPEPILFRRGYGIAGHAIQDRQIINVGNVLEDARFVHGNMPTHYQSLLVAPLLIGDRVWGTLSLCSIPPHDFSKADESLADMLARQAAVVIENAHLYTQERNQRLLAEALSSTAATINSTLSISEVLDQLLDFIIRVIPYDTANVVLINPQGYIRVVSTRGTEKDFRLENYINTLNFHFSEIPTFNQMKESGKPIVIPQVKTYNEWRNLPDSEWIQSYAGAPMRRKDHILGFINLNSRTPNYFSAKIIEQLQAFADQTAVALQNAQFFEMERHQREIADTLRDIGIILANTVNRESILIKILEQVKRLLPYDGASLWFINTERKIYVDAVVGYQDIFLENSLLDPKKVYPFDKIDNNRDILIIPNTYDQPAIFKKLFPFESWIGVPILLHGNFIGVLTLGHHQAGFYQAEYKPILASFIAQVSVAIENANLLEKIRHANTELETKVRERTSTLEKERAQLQATLEAMTEGVIYNEYTPANQNLCIQYANSAFCRLTGYQLDELVGQPTFTIIHQLLQSNTPENLFKLGGQKVYHLENGNIIWQSNITIQPKEGPPFEANVTNTIVKSSENGLALWEVMLLRDISQEKALEEQKNRFVANASHELRTPLTNIKTRVYLIRKQPEFFEKHLSIIDNSIDRMSGLIEDLLDLSRFEGGIIPLHRVQTHLQHLIEDVIYTQEAEALSKNIRLASTLPDMPIWVSVDTKRITQVITNLLINAINYTGENGNILIKVEATEQEVTLSIQDNGIGIAPEQIPHIFEPFFRATTGKATGTGLGLAIAKEIIELHEGSIWVESTLNEGSIFKIKLNRLVSPNT